MKLKILLSIMIAILLSAYLAEYVMYIKSEKVCSKFIYTSELKGATYFHYYVLIEKKRYNGSISKGSLKIKSFEELKKMNCVEAEYSKFCKYFVRINDKRVLK